MARALAQLPQTQVMRQQFFQCQASLARMTPGRQLRQIGIKKKHIKKMRRDDKLTSLEAGRRTGKGTYGWHYVKKRNIAALAGAPAAGAAGGAATVEGARRYAEHRRTARQAPVIQ